MSINRVKMLNFGKHIYRTLKLKDISKTKKSITFKSTHQSKTRPTKLAKLNNVKNDQSKCQDTKYPKQLSTNSFCTNIYICKIRDACGYLCPWYVLRRVGVPNKTIIQFRRFLKKFSYPWIIYSLPTALAMGVGDILAQYFRHRKCKSKEFHLDFYRTGKFMLIGFFILGPSLRKWFTYTTRKLACVPQKTFLAQRILTDTVILTPLMILVGLVFWEFDYFYKKFPSVKDTWNNRIKDPFWEILIFSLLTRPFVHVLLCTLTPPCLRKYIRRPFEIFYFAYVSTILMRHKPVKKEKKVEIVNTTTEKKWGLRYSKK